jgi:hypothetical protein
MVTADTERPSGELAAGNQRRRKRMSPLKLNRLPHERNGSIQIPEHELSIHAQDMVPKAAKLLIPPSISPLPPLMTPAIHFHDQANGGRQQVHDVAIRQHDLTAEVPRASRRQAPEQAAAIYAKGVFATLGRWSVSGGDDHLAFDRRFMRRFLRGAAAEVAYQAADATAVIILFQGAREHSGEMRTLNGEPKPDLNEAKKLTAWGDFHIFPIDLSWTAFFHHEDTVPVYFAQKHWLGEEHFQAEDEEL